MIGKIEAAYSARGEDPPFGLNASSLEVLQKHLAVKRIVRYHYRSCKVSGKGDFGRAFLLVSFCAYNYGINGLLFLGALFACQSHHSSISSVLSIIISTCMPVALFTLACFILTVPQFSDAERQHSQCIFTATKRCEISRCSGAEVNDRNKDVPLFKNVLTPE